MENQLFTLSKIFTERLLRIPDYQRGYAWEKRQIRDFWNDLTQIEQGSNHYTGVLTLENVLPVVYKNWQDDLWIIESRSYEPLFVVDGQQRLTTCIILIQCIIEKISEGERINYTPKEDIQRKFIFESKDGGISRSYLFGYERDNPSYEFLKGRIFGERITSGPIQETIYTQNLSQAKDFFHEQLDGYDLQKLSDFYKKITQHLLFNIFTISREVDVCVAFETMNNRGKPLSCLELLKNRLIFLSLKFDVEDYERIKLRAAINDCWRALYHSLGRNKDFPLDDDEFLFTHHTIFFGDGVLREEESDDGVVRMRRRLRFDYASNLLEKRFIARNVQTDAQPDTRITLKDIYTYVTSLQSAVEVWYDIWNPQDADFDVEVKLWLDKINRLVFRPVRPLLLVFFSKIESKHDTIRILKAAERNIFLLTMVNDIRYGPLSYNEPTPYLELAVRLQNNEITAEKVIRRIEEFSDHLARSDRFVKEVQERFGSSGFYHWRGIRYFLFEYNLELQGKSKTERKKIFWPEFNEASNDFVTVEHIYPLQARNKYWQERFSGLNQKQRESLKNSLGNLLPLSKPKNSSLSNKPFPDKVHEAGSEPIGYAYGSYAENEVAQIADWNPAEILERGKRMLEFMERRWNIKLGNDVAKRRLLGLEFVEYRQSRPRPR